MIKFEGRLGKFLLMTTMTFSIMQRHYTHEYEFFSNISRTKILVDSGRTGFRIFLRAVGITFDPTVSPLGLGRNSRSRCRRRRRIRSVLRSTRSIFDCSTRCRRIYSRLYYSYTSKNYLKLYKLKFWIVVESADDTWKETKHSKGETLW